MQSEKPVSGTAVKLTEAQRKAIYPGPGNPDYARGAYSTMCALEKLGLIERIAHWPSGNGQRGALLTAEGRAAREAIKDEH